MIIVYSKTGNTALFAQALAEMTGETIFKLEEKKKSSGVAMFLQCITKKGGEVAAMPDISNEESITLCSPIWAANFAPPLLHFLKNASLSGKKVNIVLTCGMEKSQEKYVENTKKMCRAAGAIVGATFITAMKLHPKPPTEVIKEQLQSFTNQL